MAARALPTEGNPHLWVCQQLSELSRKKLNEPVPLPLEVACLRNVTLPKDCSLSPKFHYLGITQGLYSEKTYSAQFSGEPDKTEFSWGYDAATNEVIVNGSFRGELPTWIKVGDVANWLCKELGNPTAKVLNAQFCKLLDLANKRPTAMTKSSINAQTLVDIFHGVLVQGRSVAEALAHSQTATLAAEFAVYCGATELRLDTAISPPLKDETSLELLLQCSGLSELGQTNFLKQRKIVKLKEQGVDFTNLEITFPQPINFRFNIGYSGGASGT